MMIARKLRYNEMYRISIKHLHKAITREETLNINADADTSACNIMFVSIRKREDK